MAEEQQENLSLADAAEDLLQECRMVLPGIQALFGFQLVTVFEPIFFQKLIPELQKLHFIALAMTAISVATVLAPAAYHRIAEPQSVSAMFIKLSTRLLLFSMFPLATGITLDFFIIANLILQSVSWSIVLSVVLFIIFVTLWLLFPKYRAAKRSRKSR